MIIRIIICSDQGIFSSAERTIIFYFKKRKNRYGSIAHFLQVCCLFSEFPARFHHPRDTLFPAANAVISSGEREGVPLASRATLLQADTFLFHPILLSVEDIDLESRENE